MSTSGFTGATAAPSEEARLFSWPDYLVFSVSLAIPLGIGVFFYWRSRNNQSTEEFLLGERSMNFVAVALSLLASVLNGVFVIGIPAEIHYYGVRIIYQFIGLLLSVFVVAHIFVIKYQRMLFTSAYQYVQWRYNTATRVVASLFFCVSVTIFLAIVLYVPALAFAQVTNLSIYITVVITGVICTVYTTIGGIKAVVWTDAIQIMILLAGLIVIAIVGSVVQGGGGKIWDIAEKTGRLNWNDFSFDPRHRTSFWSQVLGTAVVYIGLFISNQMTVQRYMSVPSAAKAQGSLYLALLMAVPLYILIFIIGLVLHANYASCDPLVRKVIASGDQIFPNYLMEVLGDYYGIPGLIMSSIFAAALSSVSSVINALSACVLEDFIEPALLHFRGTKLNDKKRRWIAVGIVIFFGAATIGLSFVASNFTSKIVQASNVIWGVIGGPLAGIFIMGFLMPFCNSWGAISGMFSGLIVALWVSIGNIVHVGQPHTLPVGTCNNGTIVLPTPNPNAPEPDPLMELYLVSFAWYGTIGTGVCLLVGILVSLATGGYKEEHRRSIQPSLMYSVADNCCCCCPMACIKCYRCGVEFDKTEEIQFVAKKDQKGNDEQSAVGNIYDNKGLQMDSEVDDTAPNHNGSLNSNYEMKNRPIV